MKNLYARMVTHMVGCIPMKIPFLNSFKRGKHANNAYGIWQPVLIFFSVCVVCGLGMRGEWR